MKLKDSTFAIVAEKKGSISHNWFNENIKDNQEPLSWGLDGKWIYYYEKGDWDVVLTNSFKKDCPIYTEYVFESLLKAEQENGPKKTVFGKENIAHVKKREEIGNSIEPLLKDPIDVERLKSKLEDAEKAIEIYKSNCQSKDNRIKFLEMDCERLNNVSKDYKDTIELIKRGAKMNEDDNQRLEKIIEIQECKIKDLKEMLNQRDKIILGVSEKEQHNSRNKYNDAADALSYSMQFIVEKYKVEDIKFPKTVFHPNGFAKPFKGVTITKSEAEKILRDKFKLPDYVDFKIVE